MLNNCFRFFLFSNFVLFFRWCASHKKRTCYKIYINWMKELVQLESGLVFSSCSVRLYLLYFESNANISMLTVTMLRVTMLTRWWSDISVCTKRTLLLSPHRCLACTWLYFSCKTFHIRQESLSSLCVCLPVMSRDRKVSVSCRKPWSMYCRKVWWGRQRTANTAKRVW